MPQNLSQIKYTRTYSSYGADGELEYTVKRNYICDMTENEYKLTILDENGNELSISTGNLIKTEKMIHLEDLYLSKGTIPDIPNEKNKPLITDDVAFSVLKNRGLVVVDFKNGDTILNADSYNFSNNVSVEK